MTNHGDEIRTRLKEALSWQSAHADLERAVQNVPPDRRGHRPGGLPYSLWQLLDHIRRAQSDILEYCLSSEYEARSWPDDFWPDEPEPPSREAWQESLDAIRRDRQRLAQLIDEIDVRDAIPHADEHTYLREVLLLVDHGAYHVGQMVLVRRLLDLWPP